MLFCVQLGNRIRLGQKRDKGIKEIKKKKEEEFPSWLRGCGFDPWPRSVGWGSGVAVCCGVGCRCGSEPALLWLWRRPAATAPISS